MKTQGRQHGMVKTYPIISAMWNTRPRLRASNGPTSAPMADQGTKVQFKPTNHSKFTNKCGCPMSHEGHPCPSSKSKDKAKGTQKLRSSSDVVSDYRLTTWRVVDTKSGMKLSGFSATDVLDYLDRADRVDHYYEGDEEETQY